MRNHLGPLTDDDRGMSEVVGFVLVFSLALTTIGMVYMGGYAGLQDTRDAEQINNAERAFDVLANNIDQMARNEAPFRATEVKLAEAELSTTGHYSVRTNSTSFEAAQTAGPVAIVYSIGDDTEIVYEHGAVIRMDGDSGIMIREPDLLFDNQSTVLRYIEIRGGNQHIAGSTTVLVRGERQQLRNLESVSDPGPGETVTFNLTTEPSRAPIWEEYLESEIHWEEDSCDLAGTGNETVVCEFDLDEDGSIHVSRSRIQITLT